MTSKQFYEYIGGRIRELRVGCGMSQIDLSRKLKVRQNEVCRWESGTYKVQIFDLLNVAKHLNATMQDFLPETNKVRNGKR